MGVLRIESQDDSYVIHFQSEERRINAYTLASALVGIADAAKEANAVLNPGFEVEVVVEAIGPGSFRAKIKAVYRSAKNIFSSQVLQGIVLGVVGNYIYERTLSVDNKVQVEIKTDEVIVTRGNDRVIVPRAIYDATQKAQSRAPFSAGIAQAISAIAEDEKIAAIAIVPQLDSPPPEVAIPQELIKLAAVPPAEQGPEMRVVEERSHLTIVKAILEPGRRKWEFVWRGIRISAPVLDEQFFQRFKAHEITVAPGDALDVTLVMNQSRDPKIGIYTNDSYEVVVVHDRISGPRQIPLD